VVADDVISSHVIVEDESLRAGFTQIPNLVLRRSDLPPGAKLTYMVLLSYAWQKDQAFPGQDRLARDMGVSERSVITYLKQLQESGLVSIIRRGLGLTNVYVLHRIAGSEKSADQEVKKPTPLEVQDLPAKKTQLKKTQREEDHSKLRMVPTEGYEGARDVLLPYVEDIAREFRDAAPVSSTLTRVVRLQRESGLDDEAFIGRLMKARQITKERTGAIRSGEPGRRQQVAYWLKVVEDLAKTG
jgi:biotin operon repressor